MRREGVISWLTVEPLFSHLYSGNDLGMLSSCVECLTGPQEDAPGEPSHSYLLVGEFLQGWNDLFIISNFAL